MEKVLSFIESLMLHMGDMPTDEELDMMSLLDMLLSEE